MATTPTTRPNDETIIQAPREVTGAPSLQNDDSFIVTMSDTDDANVAAADALGSGRAERAPLLATDDEADPDAEDEDDDEDEDEEDDDEDDEEEEEEVEE